MGPCRIFDNLLIADIGTVNPLLCAAYIVLRGLLTKELHDAFGVASEDEK